MAEPAKQNITQGVEEIRIEGHNDALNTKASIDVVFVPGLGAHPRESWQSDSTGWNWAFDKHGLIKDYPDARVFLYWHESAFQGSHKVEQFLDNLALGLLDSLQVRREEQPKRPLVFIGHSMGGLIIAKAITLMESRRDSYKEMVEATAGCIFFGTPFLGTGAAQVAAILAVAGEKLGLTIPSKLLLLMEPEDELLRELRGQFSETLKKASPPIPVHCFWEQKDTNTADMAAQFMRKFVGERVTFTFETLFSKAGSKFKLVSPESATLSNTFKNTGLDCNHRNLAKFDDLKDGSFQIMRAALKRILHGAPVIAKSRLNSARDTDIDMTKVTKALGGGMSYRARRRTLAQKFGSSSWLPFESEFTQWLASDYSTARNSGDSLWICGAEGRGKTGASIAALEQIEATIERSNTAEAGKAPTLLVYYFCDPADYPTAEELLKSLLWQLTQERPALASYVKQFTERAGRRAISLPIESLWQSLQDMFSDLNASSRIYILINNLHNLSDESGSTKKLLELIKDDLEVTKAGPMNRTSVRWLFTSRKAKRNIDANLNGGTSRVIDLDNLKYMNKVQVELRKYAQKKVAVLSTEKGYKRDLAYFVSSLIGNRAKSSGWIDITVDQLEKLSESENALTVRQKLKTLPQNLDDLLDGAWQQILEANPSQVDVIKEMLRALVLTYEDPSLEELAILAGFPTDEKALHKLRTTVELCSSFLTLEPAEGTEGVVSFKNEVAKPHLLRHAAKLLGLFAEETQWQQGEMTIRSLTHLIERYTLPEDGEMLEAETPTELNDEQDVGMGTDAEDVYATRDKDGANSKEGDNTDHQDASTETEAGEVHAMDDKEGAESTEGDDTDNEEDDKEDQDDEEEDHDDEEEDHDDEEEDHDDEEEDQDDEEEDQDDEEEDQDDDYQEELEAEALSYMVKHWLHHASKSTPDIAHDLSMETEFWGKDSPVRKRWLAQYKNLSDTFRFSKRYPLAGWTALHVAAAFGYQELVSALIDNGHEDELNQHDDWSYAPIHLAAFYGRSRITKELLDRGAAPDDVEKPGAETPLAMAAYVGNITVMELLLAASANVNAESDAEDSEGLVLNCAVFSGNIDAVKLLVNKGAIVHSAKRSPLQWAARLPDRRVYDYLLVAGQADLQPCDFGLALKGAAEYGNAEVFAELLEGDHEQHYVQEALTAATETTEWAIVQLILDKHKGLECDELFKEVATASEDSESPQDLEELLEVVWHYANGSISKEALDQALYEATDNEKETIVRKLLALGADANATGPDYGNALTAAAYDGNQHLVTMLLDAGAHINSKTGWALQTAAGEGHSLIVELLLNAGAEVNACTEDERFPQGTALQAAVESGILDLVNLLLNKGADANLGSGPYVCPLIAAACKAEGEILKQLVRHGANVNVDGGTSFSSAPLINTAMFLPVEYVKFLLDAGADVNHADVDGDTALTTAAGEGDEESVKLLLEHGADVRAVSSVRGNALQAAFDEDKRGCMEVLIQHVSRILLGDSKGTIGGVDGSIVNGDARAGAESGHSKTGEDTKVGLDQGDAVTITKKWVEAKQNIYDGDDWGHRDYYNEYNDTPRNLPPQAQQYDQQYNQQYNQQYGQQQQHRALTIQPGGYGQSISAQHPPHAYPSQEQHQYGQQQHQYGRQQQYGHQQQQPHGVPPPALTPGYRAKSQGVNDSIYPFYETFKN